jgi:hypothetical protein
MSSSTLKTLLYTRYHDFNLYPVSVRTGHKLRVPRVSNYLRDTLSLYYIYRRHDISYLLLSCTSNIII